MSFEIVPVRAASCVAITGLHTFVGRRLAQRLLARPNGPRVVGLDLRAPERFAGHFRRVDLTRDGADAELLEVLAEERVDTLVHAAFRDAPGRDPRYDHELETVGSLQLLNACASLPIKRLVLCSSTMVYGPSPIHPNFLSEKTALQGHPDAHSVQNRVEVEALVAGFRARQPAIEVCVLRHCWVMGPTYTDSVVSFFDRPWVPTPLGYDPMLQFVHEDDLIHAFERATLESHPGVYNVVGRGALPLSTLLQLAGKRNVPLPSALLHTVAAHPGRGRSGDAPAGFYDYLRYLWVADGERAWQRFGPPVYSTKEAWIAFVASRRMGRR